MSISAASFRLARSLAIIVFLCTICGLTQIGDVHAIGLFSPVDPPTAQYDIDCTIEFDSTWAFVSGTETILLTNNSAIPIERLALDWAIDSLHTLDIKANREAAEVLSPDSGSNLYDPVIIQLPQPISPGEELEINAQFQRTYAFESGDDRHVWTTWFPRIHWGMQTQDDFTVKIENLSKYVFASSGLYDSETDTYRATGVRRYGLYFLKGADVTEEEVEGVTVRITHTPAATECANLVMETALDAIAYYKKRFGFYPSDHIDIFQGADEPMGGYPAATNLVGVHGMERMSERRELHWRWITAHEIGHQYWFEYVMPDIPDQIGWLMIGLGVYVDREYSRFAGLAPDKHLEMMSRYTNGIREGLDTRADVHSDYVYDLGFDFNNVVVHGKGFSIISALNCLLGDELFDRIHSRCLREYAHRRLGFHDFQTVCEQENGQDLQWFFDQWVRSTRFPAYEIKSQECTPQGDEFISDIVVKKTGTLDMPVPVTAYFSDGTEKTEFTERMLPVTTIRFESASALDSAVVDVKNEIAMVMPPPSSEELKIRKALSSLPSRAVVDSLPAMVAQALEMNIDQTLFWGQLGRQLYDWALYEDALAVFERRTELLQDLESEWVVSAYGWQGLLLDLLGRRTEAISAYKKALEEQTDRDFSYHGDPVTISREWLEQRMEAPYSRATSD